VTIVADFTNAWWKFGCFLQAISFAGLGEIFYIPYTYLNSRPESFKSVITYQAIYLGIVFFFYVFASHHLAHYTIGGKKKQPFAVLVKAANGHGTFWKIIQTAD
jgi:hypothetical protein